jgi:hypothetical protein
MNHNDAEITDVIIVLECEGQAAVDESIGMLKGLGLAVADINADEGVIEGSVDAGRVNELKKVVGVRYVRSVFTYTADFPTGDPRDLDGAEDVIDEQE